MAVPGTTRLLPLALVLLLGGLTWLLDRAATLPSAAYAVNSDQPDMLVDSATAVRFGEDGRPVSQLTATHVSHLPVGDITWLEKPHLRYTAAEQPRLDVTGERAKSIKQGSEVWFPGAVKMVRAASGTQAELVINSRDMQVLPQQGIASSDAPVHAVMGTYVVESVGFIANSNTETLELKSKVRMSYEPLRTP
ncbi:LPS export ABC transporter periplasmic protein LptC [Iodobacter fluviatilis]|jgi:lipopolysaccharide export system protein LptC|uniref:LPS export ABC transporter periplasmic protein LptC n=1 Tax=Iodobacter fluviatilis TaxID=537 RepID=A0A7G3G8W9_9NEIS|nr:LPS export ABC transporter periplasmic protein LptC [Iodobacter fluviatilis]QBC43787.1 LPS export ABC transporter periplasmic protein LptC [Iodobacter fluviatilis]